MSQVSKHQEYKEGVRVLDDRSRESDSPQGRGFCICLLDWFFIRR